MKKEAMDELVKDFDKKETLIASGDLPDDIHIWDRFAYVGHEVIHTYGNYGANAKYRCVKCKVDFNGSAASYWDRECPNCFSDKEVYQLNINRSARWRCNQCKHEWDGEDGCECPSCGTRSHPIEDNNGN
jgi:DNA-directed RNA polymerase subunit RPC12/RpoP